MKRIFLISLLGVFVAVSAMGAPGKTPMPGHPCPVPSYYGPGYYTEGCDVPAEICLQGHYCPNAGWATSTVQNLKSCPSNYDNTAEGLTSIEECCLNGYDENTGLCIESTPSAPRRVAIAPSATNADCDSETLETNSGSTTLTAQWTANTITLNWYNGDTQYSTNTCTYDSGITLPSQPTKTGYNFAGWRVR
nr:InlB B-repeat-containing protein [Candidatus Enterousia merdequi]